MVHYQTMHDEALLTVEQDGTEACALCGTELPSSGENNAWGGQVRGVSDDVDDLRRGLPDSEYERADGPDVERYDGGFDHERDPSLEVRIPVESG